MLLYFLLLVVYFFSIVAKADDQEKPNFIFIFTDDVGFGDLGSYGHPYAKTPNLDRLADEGTIFKQFHVAGNVCPTSRAGFMTSRNPSWFPNHTRDFGFLGTKTVTNMLKEAGYVTGHIGKWNIGPTPEEDETTHEEYGITDLRIRGSIRDDIRGREGLRFDETVDFIKDHQNEPFYLNLWVYATHSPIEPTEPLLEQFQDLVVDRDEFAFNMQEKFDTIEEVGGDINEGMRLYLAELYGLDVQIGRILDTLDELGIADDTIVVFSSDNGPENVESLDEVYQSGYAGGLRDGKHSWYEGGTRVPFVLRWPGHVPAGKVNDQSFWWALDWLPTIGTLAGADVHWDLIEGEDVSDIWLGSDRSRVNPIFYRNLDGQNTVTMKYGKYKYLVDEDEKELYDLDTDPEERNNVYDSNPAVVAAFDERIAEWQATLPTVHAREDDTPYDFDPTEPAIIIPPPDLDGIATALQTPVQQPTAPAPSSTIFLSPPTAPVAPPTTSSPVTSAPVMPPVTPPVTPPTSSTFVVPISVVRPSELPAAASSPTQQPLTNVPIAISVPSPIASPTVVSSPVSSPVFSFDEFDVTASPMETPVGSPTQSPISSPTASPTVEAQNIPPSTQIPISFPTVSPTIEAPSNTPPSQSPVGLPTMSPNIEAPSNTPPNNQPVAFTFVTPDPTPSPTVVPSVSNTPGLTELPTLTSTTEAPSTTLLTNEPIASPTNSPTDQDSGDGTRGNVSVEETSSSFCRLTWERTIWMLLLLLI